MNQLEVYICPLPFKPPSHLPPHLTPLGWYRTPVWVSWAIQQIPVGYLFYYLFFPVTLLHLTLHISGHRAAPYSSHPSRKGQSRSSGAFREGHGPPLSHGTNWEAMPPWTDMGQSSQGPLKGVSTLGQKPGPWDWAHLTRFCLLCRPWGIWIQFYFRKNSVSFSCAYSDWEEIADSDSGTDPLQIMVMFSAISTRGSSAH